MKKNKEKEITKLYRLCNIKNINKHEIRTEINQGTFNRYLCKNVQYTSGTASTNNTYKIENRDKYNI